MLRELISVWGWLSWLFVGGQTSEIEVAVGVSLLPSALEFGSEKAVSAVSLEKLLLTSLEGDVQSVLRRGVDEQSHCVSRERLLFLFVGDDSMWQCLDEAACLDLERLSDLDNHAIFGYRNLDDLPVFSLPVKSNCRIRPANLVTVLISIESWSQACQHTNIFVPPSPLTIEVFFAGVIVDEPTCNLGSFRYCTGDEVVFNWRQSCLHVGVNVSREM